MTPILHLCGIIIKYIFLNSKVLLKILLQKHGFHADFSEIDTIVFTHNLGGGTASYEKQKFKGRNILIVRMIPYRNDFAFSLESEMSVKVMSANKVFALLKQFSPENVVVNSLCGYENPARVLKFIENNFSHSHNTYLVHDFHCICNKNNSALLLKEKYCGLKCKGCKYERKSGKWRSVWRVYFSMVKEVICFSNSSKEIILSVYPEIAGKVSVIPHSMSYCDFTPMNIDKCNNIAVVGNCSNIAKGKLVIKKLVKNIKIQQKRKLYIIGKAPYFFHRNSEYVEYLGKYDLKILPETLHSGQIGVIVFTSILPETFSYAISEFMMLGLYIVSLDLGAQGEKLKNYPKAVFVKDLKPETIIAGVERCFTL